MLTEKEKRVLAAIRARTDDFTVKRRRKEIGESQKGLEEF